MKNEEKILDKIDRIKNDVDSIERVINKPKFSLSDEVKHSLIWGTVLIILALIVLWAIRISH